MLRTCGGNFFFQGNSNNTKVLDSVDNILRPFRLTKRQRALKFTFVAVRCEDGSAKRRGMAASRLQVASR